MEEPLEPRPGARPTLRLPERLAAALLLAVAAVATAFLAIPGALPEIPGEEALGLPAPATVRAPRDLAIPDEEGTRRRRGEASADEPRVFDSDLGAEAEVAARVHGAFQLMRSTEARWQERRAPGRKETRADQAELLRDFAARRDDFASRLQLWVDDGSFAALSEARFDEGTEEKLLWLTRRGLAAPVVEDRSLLAADRERGIRVRDVQGGGVGGSGPSGISRGSATSPRPAPASSATPTPCPTPLHACAPRWPSWPPSCCARRSCSRRPRPSGDGRWPRPGSRRW